MGIVPQDPCASLITKVYFEEMILIPSVCVHRINMEIDARSNMMVVSPIHVSMVVLVFPTPKLIK